MTRERFAPSPTGLLHLGHAYSALLAYDAAQKIGGAFILRIEDIDGPRSRTEFEDQMFDDLKWLGLSWHEPIMRQSERMEAYQSALDKLNDQGLIFPCSCTRKDIQTALSAPQEGDTALTVYPGTCRHRSMDEWKTGDAIRLNISKAIDGLSDISFSEIGQGHQRHITEGVQALAGRVGDIVLARKDIKTSYHLAVVVDDAAQGITHVTRGEDMMELTAIHVLLQQLLGLKTPIYRHHKLIRDENGKRLAKRHDAMSIKTYRDAGYTADKIRNLVGL